METCTLRVTLFWNTLHRLHVLHPFPVFLNPSFSETYCGEQLNTEVALLMLSEILRQ